MSRIAKKVIADCKAWKNEMDMNARICYMFTKPNDIDFIDASLAKYPECLIMSQLRGCMWSFAQQHTKALKYFEFINKRDPRNYENLYHMA